MSSEPPNLKEQAFSAVRWTAVSAATGAIVQLLQVVMLTRILTPADYGVIAIVAAVLGFSGIAGAATNIAWVLFVVFVILAIISLLRGRR